MTMLDVDRRADGSAGPSPATAATAANRLPREFLGKARDLRRVLLAEDAITFKEVGRLTTPFASVSRGTVPRPQMLERAAIAWQERIPTAGRISLSIKRTKTSLIIDEIHIGAGHIRFAEWDEDVCEQGFAVTAMRLEVVYPRFHFDHVILAGLSLHAVGRWFQRSFDCSHPALLSDLRLLAAGVTDERLANGGDFEIPAGDGKWCGVVSADYEQSGRLFLATRTFLEK